MSVEIPAARLERIRELLHESRVVSLRRVQAELGVSEMTVRRDFLLLEEMGVVRRTRGGVVMADRVAADVPYDARETFETQAKRAIGEHAATLIEPGDTIFLSGGTTCRELATVLARASGIVVITNSVDAIVTLSGNPDLVVIATGGRASHQNHDLTGPLAQGGIEQHRAEKAFVGASGVTPAGIFNSNVDRGWADRTMIGCANETYVLADHTKIDKVSLSLVVELGRVEHLVTDVLPEEKDLSWMRSAGVEVHAAAADAAATSAAAVDAAAADPAATEGASADA